MDAIQLLHTRHSALKLGEPPPSPEAIRVMLESAARVPDHGRLLPWRVILIEGEARRRLGDVFVEALSRRNPLANEQTLEREREKAMRAPLVIVVATRCDRSARVPAIEQTLSAGCAALSIMQAAFAQGLGAMWRTGENAYDESVKAALGVGPDDIIVGFLYVGTNTGGRGPRPAPSIEAFAERWNGVDTR